MFAEVTNVVAFNVPAVTPVEAKSEVAVTPVTFRLVELTLVKTELIIVLFVAKTEPVVTLPAEIPVEAKSEATVAPEAFTLVELTLVRTKFVTVPREANTDPAVTLPAEILVARIEPAVASVTLNEEILLLRAVLLAMLLLTALKLPTEILAAEIPVEAKSEATVTPEAFTLVALALVTTQFVTVPRGAYKAPVVTLVVNLAVPVTSIVAPGAVVAIPTLPPVVKIDPIVLALPVADN